MRFFWSRNIPNRWYWTFKYVLIGPLLRLYNRPVVEHLDRIPAEGAAIIASNHQAVMDSFYFPLVCPRQLTFPAKSEYFTTPGFVGRMQRWFFSAVGQVPLDRTSSDAAEQLMTTASDILARGELFGIYPEGTRSPDGRVYRGKVGMARLALTTGHPVIPIGMIDTRDANPIGSWVPRPTKVHMVVGEPIDPIAFVRERGLEPDSHKATRVLTDHVMHELARLASAEYVDMYAADVKASLEAGLGYPDAADE